MEYWVADQSFLGGCDEGDIVEEEGVVWMERRVAWRWRDFEEGKELLLLLILVILKGSCNGVAFLVLARCGAGEIVVVVVMIDRTCRAVLGQRFPTLLL